MARASTPTLLPLDTFAAIMGLNPFEFNQFTVANIANGSCVDVWYQYEWQRRYLSREEIARTIARAEGMIARQIGYWPAPTYIVGESAQIVQNQRYGWYPSNAWWKHRMIQAQWQKVLGGGILARTLIDASAAVTYSDEDGDGIDELFTVTVATTVTATDEIGVYFTATDRNNVAIAEQWRIRPVTVTISGGVATITGSAAACGLPNATTVVDPVALDPTDPTNFVTDLAVYRVYRDDTQQGNAYWERLYGDCTSTPCTQTEKAICLIDRRGVLGQLAVALTEPTCCDTWRAPDQVTVNYLAGEPLVNGTMSDAMADLVAHLAAGLLPRLSCGCERADEILAFWRHDVAADTVDVRARPLLPSEQTSPWGTSAGALYAWNRVKDYESMIGVSTG